MDKRHSLSDCLCRRRPLKAPSKASTRRGGTFDRPRLGAEAPSKAADAVPLFSSRAIILTLFRAIILTFLRLSNFIFFVLFLETERKEAERISMINGMFTAFSIAIGPLDWPSRLAASIGLLVGRQIQFRTAFRR